MNAGPGTVMLKHKESRPAGLRQALICYMIPKQDTCINSWLIYDICCCCQSPGCVFIVVAVVRWFQFLSPCSLVTHGKGKKGMGVVCVLWLVVVLYHHCRLAMDQVTIGGVAMLRYMDVGRVCTGVRSTSQSTCYGET